MDKLLFKQVTLGASTMILAMNVFASNPRPDTSSTTNNECTNCDYTRGPNPTKNSLEASKGVYSVKTVNVSRFSASGFGGGTIYYPTGTSGKMGAIAVIPGYLSYESDIEWWGPKLASHGFVVITMNTNTIYDQPDSRADQLSSALDYMVSQGKSGSSAISGMVDSTRLGVIGWSMGGGGSLKLATERKLKAIIPQAPWYSGSNKFNTITTPTMIIACESDLIAPVSSHASPFYNRIPNSTPKALLEINGGSHYCANTGYPDENLLGKYGVSWMKRFIDQDTRYSQFLCGPNHTSNYNISEYRDTCNY